MRGHLRFAVDHYTLEKAVIWKAVLALFVIILGLGLITLLRSFWEVITASQCKVADDPNRLIKPWQ